MPSDQHFECACASNAHRAQLQSLMYAHKRTHIEGAHALCAYLPDLVPGPISLPARSGEGR